MKQSESVLLEKQLLRPIELTSLALLLFGVVSIWWMPVSRGSQLIVFFVLIAFALYVLVYSTGSLCATRGSRGECHTDLCQHRHRDRGRVCAGRGRERRGDLFHHHRQFGGPARPANGGGSRFRIGAGDHRRRYGPTGPLSSTLTTNSLSLIVFVIAGFFSAR